MNEIILVVYLTFSGFNMSIDPEQMYGITKIEECNKKLPDIINDYNATEGSCFMGSMTERLEKV
jgi:hypothetical protein|tara:strand:+ start:147 stop:338 length:192 start_codon:yes stop_codon:yes gene_type:complete